jgi:hypothetical protein
MIQTAMSRFSARPSTENYATCETVRLREKFVRTRS